MVWYDDFQELSTDRQLGMIAGPIPHSSIEDHVKGWSWEDAEMFRICMRRMDSFWLSFDPKAYANTTKTANMTPQDRLSAIFGGMLHD